MSGRVVGAGCLQPCLCGLSPAPRPRPSLGYAAAPVLARPADGAAGGLRAGSGASGGGAGRSSRSGLGASIRLGWLGLGASIRLGWLGMGASIRLGWFGRSVGVVFLFAGLRGGRLPQSVGGEFGFGL